MVRRDFYIGLADVLDLFTLISQSGCNGHGTLLLGDLRSQYAPLIAESSGVMAQLVWADDQPLVSKYIIACLDRSEVH